MNLKNVLLIICLAFISEGYSWWDEGHSLVCNKAANLMSTDTSANLFSILESDDYGEGCVWPDVIKQVVRQQVFLIFEDLPNRMHSSWKSSLRSLGIPKGSYGFLMDY